MDNELETSQEEIAIKRDEKGRLLEGHGLISPGRPKGSVSIKDLVRKHLEDNPEDLQEFVQHFIKKNRELAWQMLEGKPQQDIVSDGKQLPTPIYGWLSGHTIDKEDI
mgnify:CR=1 FL=1